MEMCECNYNKLRYSSFWLSLFRIWLSWFGDSTCISEVVLARFLWIIDLHELKLQSLSCSIIYLKWLRDEIHWYLGAKPQQCFVWTWITIFFLQEVLKIHQYQWLQMSISNIGIRDFVLLRPSSFWHTSEKI